MTIGKLKQNSLYVQRSCTHHGSMTAISEILGWAGAGCLLLAYALISTRRLAVDRAYQLLNLAGSLGLAVNGIVHRAWPSTALNLLWIAVGLAGIINTGAAITARSRPRGPASCDEQGVQNHCGCR